MDSTLFAELGERGSVSELTAYWQTEVCDEPGSTSYWSVFSPQFRNYLRWTLLVCQLIPTKPDEDTLGVLQQTLEDQVLSEVLAHNKERRDSAVEEEAGEVLTLSDLGN